MNFMRGQHVDHSAKLNEEMAMMSFLDHMLVQAKEAEPKRTYLGGSRIGHPMAPTHWERGCERALWFEYKKYASDRPFPAKLYRIFDMGHAVENIVAANIRAAGFTLITDDGKGEQFGFALSRDPETGEARYRGHCDGVITAGPALIGSEKDGIRLRYPFLWENKGVNDKKFEKFKAEGVERSHPTYYGQILQYQNFLQLYENPALLTMVNRDSGEIYPEFVRFNQRHCQAIIDRAARVIEAKGPLVLERANEDYEKAPCKWCDYQSHCKAAEQNKTAAGSGEQQQAPSWLGSK